MKKQFWFIYLITPLIFIIPSKAQERVIEYPQIQISNNQLAMKLYLPDPEEGYYRATRFDWSGIIYSLEYNGHQYFGEWKNQHNPSVHEDLTGPAESFRGEGLGFEEAEPGGEFMRIGVGMLEKTDQKQYLWNHTYKIIDNGEWTTEYGKDWIKFQHRLKSKAGWAYIYTKRISLLDSPPGFTIKHILENTGNKTIETDQFNHNFFVMDGDTTGPDFNVEFPFEIISVEGLQDRIGAVKIENNNLSFIKTLDTGHVWMDLKGFGDGLSDHQFKLTNKKTGATVHVKVNKPLYKMVFWATTKTLCPENFIFLKIEPGHSETWVSEYILSPDSTF